MSVGSPTAGTWSSSQWRADNEFETDKTQNAAAHRPGGRQRLSHQPAGVADQPVSQTAVCDMRPRVPSGERCRVSYTVSDSMSCIRRARVPVPCAELALRSARTDGLGDRRTVQPFTPTATGGSSYNNAQRRPDVRRHATLPQSWIQRENWEFETHRWKRSAAWTNACTLASFTALAPGICPASYDAGSRASTTVALLFLISSRACATSIRV